MDWQEEIQSSERVKDSGDGNTQEWPSKPVIREPLRKLSGQEAVRNVLLYGQKVSEGIALDEQKPRLPQRLIKQEHNCHDDDDRKRDR
jgi:hypothetical protein